MPTICGPALPYPLGAPECTDAALIRAADCAADDACTTPADLTAADRAYLAATYCDGRPVARVYEDGGLTCGTAAPPMLPDTAATPPGPDLTGPVLVAVLLVTLTVDRVRNR